MKSLICCALLAICTSCFAADVKITKFRMDSEYTKQHSQSLITKIDLEYQVNLYEPLHKKWVLYLGGKLSPDYDHFGNEVKMNAFTTFGIDF